MPTNPNGRPPDPETQAEAQSFAERFVSKRIRKYLQVLDDIAQSDDTAADQRRMAISTLFERGLGKPAVPERDDQLGKLAEVLKQIARISGQKPDTRVIAVAPRGALPGGADVSDRGSGGSASEQTSPVDYAPSEGDS